MVGNLAKDGNGPWRGAETVCVRVLPAGQAAIGRVDAHLTLFCRRFSSLQPLCFFGVSQKEAGVSLPGMKEHPALTL